LLAGQRLLAGRAALVTGGSRGIGRAVALAFARAGADVAVGYFRSAQAAEAVAGAAAACSVRAFALQADVADPAQAATLVEAALNRFGRLDILVNNAGIASSKLLLDTSPEEWNRMLAVHLTGAYACTRAALPAMIRQGGGRVINITSIWGQVGAALEVPYSTAKAGLIGFTRALAKEVGRAGITVNAIAPGAIATDMLGEYTAEELANLTRTIPLGTIGRPEHVAAAALYLASPQAAYVTGQVLGVGGGIVM
jgi:3-oxoacyl-[acyl-carrier protein] reductase